MAIDPIPDRSGRMRIRRGGIPDTRAGVPYRFSENSAPAGRAIDAPGMRAALYFGMRPHLRKLPILLGAGLLAAAIALVCHIAGAPAQLAGFFVAVAAIFGSAALFQMLGLAILLLGGLAMRQWPWRDLNCHPEFASSDWNTSSVTLLFGLGDGTPPRYKMSFVGQDTLAWRDLADPHVWVAGRPGRISVVVPANRFTSPGFRLWVGWLSGRRGTP